MSAKEIFERVRDIPYRLPEFIGDEAPQCAYKSQILVKELSVLGYQVRTRIAEMDWEQTLFPKEIIALDSKEIVPTHMYIEILIDDVWRALDASWDKGLAKAGFPVAEYDGSNSPGLPLIRVFDFQEQEEYLKYWSDPNRIKNYFKKSRPFSIAVNKWLLSIRS